MNKKSGPVPKNLSYTQIFFGENRTITRRYLRIAGWLYVISIIVLLLALVVGRDIQSSSDMSVQIRGTEYYTDELADYVVMTLLGGMTVTTVIVAAVQAYRNRGILPTAAVAIAVPLAMMVWSTITIVGDLMAGSTHYSDVPLSFWFGSLILLGLALTTISYIIGRVSNLLANSVDLIPSSD